MNTLQQSRQDIRDRLANNFSQESIEGSVPSAKQLRRIDGAVYPYIIFRFPDVTPGADTSFVGPWGDSYIQAVFFLPVGPDIDSAQQLYMKILDKFLGFQPSNSGLMTKISGGGTYEIGSDNGATQAYISPLHFRFQTSLRELP